MGWIKKTRDTGFLDVTPGIQASANYISGRLLLRRHGDVVTVILDDLVVDKVGTSTLFILPTGFRPFHVERTAWWQPNAASNTAGGTLNTNANGYVVGYAMAASTPMTGRQQFDCVQAWPSTFPGIEVQL